MKFEIKTAEQLAAEAQLKATEVRIAELKRMLAETDFKAMPDYDQPNADILTQRQAWREEIRALGG